MRCRRTWLCRVLTWETHSFASVGFVIEVSERATIYRRISRHELASIQRIQLSPIRATGGGMAQKINYFCHASVENERLRIVLQVKRTDAQSMVSPSTILAPR